MKILDAEGKVHESPKEEKTRQIKEKHKALDKQSTKLADLKARIEVIEEYLGLS